MCYRDALSHEKNSVAQKRGQVSSLFSVIVRNPTEELQAGQRKLPEVVRIGDDKYMVLRQKITVVDMYQFKNEKERHNRLYSDLMMLCHWENERDFLGEAEVSLEACENMYYKFETNIRFVRTGCHELGRRFALR